MRIIQMIDDGLETSYSLKASKLLTEIWDANCMMQNPVGTKVVRIWPPNNAYNREILTIGPRNTVDDTKPSNSECDHNGTYPFPSGVPISRISGIYLITTPNIIDARLVK
jgi:hypothetical protein